MKFHDAKAPSSATFWPEIFSHCTEIRFEVGFANSLVLAGKGRHVVSYDKKKPSNPKYSPHAFHTFGVIPN